MIKRVDEKLMDQLKKSDVAQTVWENRRYKIYKVKNHERKRTISKSANFNFYLVMVNKPM